MEKRDDRNPREMALRILHDIEAKDTLADYAILSCSRKLRLSSLDRRFLGELVHGTTKMRRRLDFILSQFLERKLDELTPWMRNILRMGIYQIDFLKKVPARAAVDESVKLAKIFGHKGTIALVNAVLRSYLREKNKIRFPSMEEDKVKNIALFYSFPDWMVQMWLETLGEEETIKLCQAFNQRPRLCFRINSLKIDKDDLERMLAQERIKFKSGRLLDAFYLIESKVDLDRFGPLENGLIYIQDESAGFPVYLLDPRPGEVIVDLCAAPGGKSTFMAERMMNQGLVLAVDVNPGKLEILRENYNRLGVDCIGLCCADAQNFSCRLVDKVLVDAPCSALGTLGRHSDARWRKQREDLFRLQKLQLAILSNAAELLREGGIMVYSTCTITSEENEQVVDKFLSQREDFKIADASLFVPSDVVDRNGLVRTLPHIHKMDGSFACRLEKTKSG